MGVLVGKGFNAQKAQFNTNSLNQIKIIGKGGFGCVWKVIHKKTNRIYALKIMSKAKIIVKKSVDCVLNQRQILIKVENPFLVNIFSAFQDRQNLYLLLDYLDGGDLRNLINNSQFLSEQQIKFIIQCIMEGLHYLHNRNILHRDIKPENIIFDKNGYCRITDMGIARFWKVQNAHETSGTPGYMSPQVIMRQNHSFCADYFAVGVITYQLVIGKRPYYGKTRHQMREDILSRQIKILSPFKQFSHDCIDFINKMMQRSARKRLGFNGISQILEHPWIKMTKTERQLFRLKKLQSPIILGGKNYNNNQYIISETNQAIKQTMLLLKKPVTQQLFNNYEYSRPPIKVKNTDQFSTINTIISSTQNIK